MFRRQVRFDSSCHPVVLASLVEGTSEKVYTEVGRLCQSLRCAKKADARDFDNLTTKSFALFAVARISNISPLAPSNSFYCLLVMRKSHGAFCEILCGAGEVGRDDELASRLYVL